MSEQIELKHFAAELWSQITDRATGESDDPQLLDTFTQYMIEELIEAGDIDDGMVCLYRSRGIEIHGYSIGAEGETVDLFVSIFEPGDEIETLGTPDVDTAFKRLSAVWQKAGESYHLQIQESSTVRDMFEHLAGVHQSVHRLRLFILTNTISRIEYRTREAVDGLAIEYHIWDLRRLYRHIASGRAREALEISFPEYGVHAVPALKTVEAADGLVSYLMILPGDLLASIYRRYGERLLERNVRSFLQVRGKVNRGIRETILKSPERFLAYNNGVSATAHAVDFAWLEDGTMAISRIDGFQIVNGGQTTATIHYTATKDRADVSNVSVQCKLTVVAAHQIGEIVPLISRYSNTQNKINEADFSANDDLHVEIEKLSRTVYAPATPATGRQTLWYYERARGQYQDEVGRTRTPAAATAFKRINPANQKFTKTDLAKYIHTWEGRAELVSRGAQKNFVEFTLRLEDGHRDPLTLPAVDRTFFQRTIAQAILFHATEEIVTSLNFGGYRANIVAYTLALLATRIGRHLDLDDIWQRQAIPRVLIPVIKDVARQVYEVITNPTTARNITEWCKTRECLARVQRIDWQPSAELIYSLKQAAAQRGLAAPLTPEQEDLIRRMSKVPASVWTSITNWGKDTGRISMQDRAFAQSLVGSAERGKALGPKSAKRASDLIDDVRAKGFALPADLNLD